MISVEMRLRWATDTRCLVGVGGNRETNPFSLETPRWHLLKAGESQLARAKYAAKIRI
jgi:hypothetical protein